MKNLEIKKTFSVNGKEYDCKESAMKAIAREVLNTEIPKGVESIIENAAQIIQALKVLNR